MGDWEELCDMFGFGPDAQWEDVERALRGKVRNRWSPSSSSPTLSGDEARARPSCSGDEARKREIEAFKASGGLVVNVGSDVELPLVKIELGQFVMGSPAVLGPSYSREAQHEVTISKPFWLGQTAVTQAEWQAVMGSNPSRFKVDLNCPVECVSWNDAQEFCQRLTEKTGMTFRLPTEAEWEYACRAGTTTAYYFGDDQVHWRNDNRRQLGDYAWFNDNSGGTTRPVATKLPNAFGLYDMHGNVWEWCSDWYGDYPGGAVTDPEGPGSGSDRVLRGGCFYCDPHACRAAFRFFSGPVCRCGIVGFRVARSS